MTPAARVQGAIEILDAVIEAASTGGAPADRLIADYFRARRYAGSKDRRAVRDLTYAAIRACGPVPASGRAAMLRLAAEDPALALLFDGSAHAPAPIAEGEQIALPGLAPEWLERALAQSGIAGPPAEALLARAPLDIRVNTLKADRGAIDLPAAAVRTEAPQGLRLEPGTRVEQWDVFRDGLVEVQDTGSQLACQAVAAAPGETIVDLCAGAGGKTLALAAEMGNRGTLVACDTDRQRLSRLAPRAERAGAGMIETRLLDPGKELESLEDLAGKADAVLVDAPCSGTGTWRRNPEARWRLTPGRLARFVEAQERLLGIAADLVRPEGRLIYVTCSLLDAEGADQIDRFLAARSDWSAGRVDLPLGRARGKGWRVEPFHDGTDGFFIARATRAC
ncbi:RsmB/NOP family class I SAM-dependent RNA methyltransferase [Tsuneonella sp. YG55]|uniref:RsmB/NOP family class I SAM-dependent RNA methyltransferase n=1 Tax=Tsuneonella litorea TaxID=2976475 RepID=A0A9X2VZT8_9SPHN|nr:RsmB/NOP family class I SAM-dependent RNA methyltransferase [Tsuneonella litorea]MCT2558201.1 RsmB/NOP family class I SAM-dependent RNA methyltransferase [Tsuneonella litorea]